MAKLRKQDILWKLLGFYLIGCICSIIGTAHGQPPEKISLEFNLQENSTLSTKQDFPLEERENSWEMSLDNDAETDMYETDDENQDVESVFRSALNSFTNIDPDEMEPKESQDTITIGDIMVASAFPAFCAVVMVASLYTVHKFRRYSFLRRERLRQRWLETQLRSVTVVSHEPITEQPATIRHPLDTTYVTTDTQRAETALTVRNREFFPQSRSFKQILTEIEKEVENEASNTPETQNTGIVLVTETPLIPSENSTNQNLPTLVSELIPNETSTNYNLPTMVTEPPLIPDETRNNHILPTQHSQKDLANTTEIPKTQSFQIIAIEKVESNIKQNDSSKAIKFHKIMSLPKESDSNDEEIKQDDRF